MLLLLLPLLLLLLKLSQCFCTADHTQNSSNYRMEGGGMYLGVWMSVRVFVCECRLSMCTLMWIHSVCTAQY